MRPDSTFKLLSTNGLPIILFCCSTNFSAYESADIRTHICADIRTLVLTNNCLAFSYKTTSVSATHCAPTSGK